jgi:hypothetical protein
MHEFAYFSIGGLPTKSGCTASAASQYSLRDLHVNIMLNPHAATQVRKSSYERQAGSNPKVRVADYMDTIARGCGWSFRTCCYSGKSRLIEVSKFRCRACQGSLFSLAGASPLGLNENANTLRRHGFRKQVSLG